MTEQQETILLANKVVPTSVRPLFVMKTKVHSDLRNCVQVFTLVDDQWIEFARVWYGPERFVEDKEEAIRARRGHLDSVSF